MSRVSNYDKALAGARAAFLAHDPAALAAKYPVEWDGRCLRLRFAGEPYRIDAETGAVDCPDRPGYVPGHDELMSIWDMLCFADARPAPAGEWCPTASLADIAGGQDASHLLTRFREAVSAAPEKLEDARLALRASRDGGADFAMVIPAFDWFPCRFCFWQADDEFPAQVVFYWDRNARRFVRYETLWFMNMYLSRRIWAAVEGRDWWRGEA